MRLRLSPSVSRGLRGCESLRRLGPIVASFEDEDSQPVDVLAAEEFAVPAPDPAFRPEVLRLPPDPVADEPHDVLAAEEFAMPSPDEAHPILSKRRRQKQLALNVGVNLLPLVGLWLLRRVRRARRAG